MFGKQLRKLRIEHNVAAKCMAELLGITYRNYQRYERGEIDPPLSKATVLADYFQVPVDYLLGRGVFEHWDKIMEHRDYVCRRLKPLLPFWEKNGIDISAIDERSLMAVFAASLEKIDYSEKDGHPHFEFSLLPVWIDPRDPDFEKRTEDLTQGTFGQRFEGLLSGMNAPYSAPAESAGVSLDDLKQYITGEREPSLSVLIALADYFDVSLDYLVGRSDDPSRH